MGFFLETGQILVVLASLLLTHDLKANFELQQASDVTHKGGIQNKFTLEIPFQRISRVYTPRCTWMYMGKPTLKGCLIFYSKIIFI